MNTGLLEMKGVMKSELRNLRALKKEKNELEKKYINTKTSDLERERITLRLTKFLLPAIRRLENTLKSQARQTMSIEKGIQKIKTAQNRITQLKAQEKKPTSSLVSLFKKPNTSATRKNHLTPQERRNVEELEANLIKEFGPITQQNIINESRRMKAEENALLDRIMKNWKSAKSQEQKNYYTKMMEAVINQSQYRMITPEEEREVNEALAQLGGKKRRMTRRRR
jgi:hypothetical protein